MLRLFGKPRRFVNVVTLSSHVAIPRYQPGVRPALLYDDGNALPFVHDLALIKLLRALSPQALFLSQRDLWE